MAPHICAAANQLVELWIAKLNRAGGNSFDTASDIKLATMVNSVITGESFGCLVRALSSLSESTSIEPGVAQFSGSNLPPICRAINTMMRTISLGLELPFASVLLPVYTRVNPSWRSDHRLIYTYLWDLVEEARARETTLAEQVDFLTDADCVVDMLVQQEVRGESESLNKPETLDELMTFAMGGQETTAAALMWFVKYMALDLDIQQHLHQEVCEVFGHSLTDSASITLEVLDDVNKTPVLEAVTSETLRCALVGSATDFLAGTDIMALNGLLGLSEEAWGPDANQWRPSRWLRPDGSFNRDAGPSGNPFGVGQRACFGQRLATMQLKIFFTTLSRAFIFKRVALTADVWTSITLVTNQPTMSYVTLDRWDS
ncbi:cytochrome P450 family protein [Ceratobasidium sp. AG-Ba]|nr:cytochrome P450 family protein [Ceratobasidium sp. AG-Ba]QRW08562.1 cytochrome P450 family protein [Ceratobasidium sp. AG-Ba]